MRKISVLFSFSVIAALCGLAGSQTSFAAAKVPGGVQICSKEGCVMSHSHSHEERDNMTEEEKSWFVKQTLKLKADGAAAAKANSDFNENDCVPVDSLQAELETRGGVVNSELGASNLNYGKKTSGYTFECRSGISAYKKADQNTNMAQSIGAGLTGMVGQQQFNSAQQSNQQSAYFNAAGNTGFVGAAAQTYLGYQMMSDAKKLKNKANEKNKEAESIYSDTAKSQQRMFNAFMHDATTVNGYELEVLQNTREESFHKDGVKAGRAQQKLATALSNKAVLLEQQAAIQLGMAAKNGLLANANKGLANKLDGLNEGFTLPPGGGGEEEVNNNQDPATSTDPTFPTEDIAGNTLGPPGVDAPADAGIDAPEGAGFQKPEGAGGTGPLGSSSIGGGSTQAGKAEKEKGAEYAVQAEGGSKYARGGGIAKSGAEDKGPDLSGLLAQFLPKDADEKGKHSILDFGRQPGSAPISLLDKGVNIFERIHIRYQNEQKNNSVGM